MAHCSKACQRKAMASRSPTYVAVLNRVPNVKREGGSKGGESDHHTARAAYYVTHCTLPTGVFRAQYSLSVAADIISCVDKCLHLAINSLIYSKYTCL